MIDSIVLATLDDRMARDSQIMPQSPCACSFTAESLEKKALSIVNRTSAWNGMQKSGLSGTAGNPT
jgi:hypothetical protein